MEFTTPLPCKHFSPASITSHLELSTITGTRAISDSPAIRRRNFSIAALESSMPSSILTSTICAPPSTCCLATLTAFSKSPARTSLANTGEPVTFVRSPMLMKFDSGRTVTLSSPLKRRYGSISASSRGGESFTVSAIAFMCAGVVPQQPPTILSQPLSAHSRSCGAKDSGVSGKPVGSSGSGKPALG